MTSEVLEILVRNLTNERLDSIVQQDIRYQDSVEATHIALEQLEQISSDKKELHKIIDNYDSAIRAESALYASYAYKQGMKDFAQLLLSLV